MPSSDESALPVFRYVGTGWRLASAQAALGFAGMTLLVFAVIALVAGDVRVLGVGSLVALGFALLGLLLLLFVRRGAVDPRTRVLCTVSGETIPFEDLAAVVLLERRGEAASGSGSRYRYALWNVTAVLRGHPEAPLAVLEDLAVAAGDVPDPLPVPPGALPDLEAFASEPPRGAVVTLIDAASLRRATHVGWQAARLVGVPCVAVTVHDGGPASVPGPPAHPL